MVIPPLGIFCETMITATIISVRRGRENMSNETVVVVVESKAPTNLRVNDRIEPVDLEPGGVPVLRWTVPLVDVGVVNAADEVTANNTVVAYEVIVSSTYDKAESGNGDVWDSGHVEGDGFDGVSLSGIDMAPSRRYWASVRVWRGTEDSSKPTAWSEPTTFGTGAGKHWEAAEPIWPDPLTANPYRTVELPESIAGKDREISTDDQFAKRPDPMTSEHNSQGWALFRGYITLPKKSIRWATLNATAASVSRARQFVYRMWLNGHFVGFGPTFPIDGETRYDGYDVTRYLVPGRDNFIGVIAYALEDQRFMAQLDVMYEDGTLAHFGTGEDWLSRVGNNVWLDGASVGTHVYELPAENIQAAAYPRGMSEVGYDDIDWAVSKVKPAFDELKATPFDKPTLRERKAVKKWITDDGRLIVDFGRAVAGGIRLAARVSRPTDLVIRFGECLNDQGTVQYRLDSYNEYQDVWHYVPNKLNVPVTVRTWGLRVFRYVEILPTESNDENAQLLRDLLDSDSALEAQALLYPFRGPSNGFASSNETLNQVWQLCRNTVESLNVNMYVDSWTRERIPYEADAWLQQRAHMSLDADSKLGEYSIDYLLANRTWPTEWPLYLVLAVYDAWVQTGSLQQAAEQWDRIVAMLPDKYLDDTTGLIVKDPGESSTMDGDLVDWPPAERDGFVFGRVNTVINALAAQSYMCAGVLALKLGKVDASRRYQRIASRMRKAINRYLWNDEVGAYADGLDTGVDGKQIAHCSEHASAFALAFAHVPADRLPRVGAFIRSKGMACSVYVASVLLEGLYKGGQGVYANELMAASEGERTWRHMIDEGAGATMEAWSRDLKSNTTYSHPWAASPAFLLPRYMVGVHPLEPGFREFVMAPQPGSIGEASAKVSIATGVIEAGYKVLGDTVPTAEDQSVDGIEITLVVPIGTTADVIVPPTKSGAPIVLDGVETVVADARYGMPSTIPQGSYPAGARRIHGLTAGRHVIQA